MYHLNIIILYKIPLKQNVTNMVIITSKIMVNGTFIYPNKIVDRSKYSNKTRMNQTIETIKSIRLLIPNSFIILLDNSELSDENRKYLQDNCDIF